MTRMLRKMSVTLQQQNSPAPREGAGQRMNGGATDERARQRRGSRDIAGEECGDVPMRGIDVFIARAEAHHPRPQPDGTAGHARTRSEVVATPEAATGPGRPGGGIQASVAHQRMRICGCASGAGYVSAPDASQTRIRTVQERRQMRTRRTAHGTKTPRLPSKGTPHSEDLEVTHDQRI